MTIKDTEHMTQKEKEERIIKLLYEKRILKAEIARLQLENESLLNRLRLSEVKCRKLEGMTYECKTNEKSVNSYDKYKSTYRNDPYKIFLKCKDGNETYYEVLQNEGDYKYIIEKIILKATLGGGDLSALIDDKENILKINIPDSVSICDNRIKTGTIEIRIYDKLLSYIIFNILKRLEVEKENSKNIESKLEEKVEELENKCLSLSKNDDVFGINAKAYEHGEIDVLKGFSVLGITPIENWEWECDWKNYCIDIKPNEEISMKIYATNPKGEIIISFIMYILKETKVIMDDDIIDNIRYLLLKLEEIVKKNKK